MKSPKLGDRSMEYDFLFEKFKLKFFIQFVCKFTASYN